ncbi:hypothetical protein PENTCL1PPCAC_20555, partial [Pristionchus entomophagus]
GVSNLISPAVPIIHKYAHLPNTASKELTRTKSLTEVSGMPARLTTTPRDVTSTLWRVRISPTN